MPTYHDIDYFAKKVFYHQKKIRSLLLQKNETVLSTSIESLKDEVYRKPWDVFDMDHQKTVSADSKPFSQSYIIEVSKIGQLEPLYRLDVNEVTQGLIVENFADPPSLLSPPIIATVSSSNSFDVQSYHNDLEKNKFVPVDEASHIPPSNIGKEDLLPPKKLKIESFWFHASDAFISNPVFSDILDSPQKRTSQGKIEEAMVLAKMSAKSIKAECFKTQEIASSAVKKTNDMNVHLIQPPISYNYYTDVDSDNFRFSNIDFDLVKLEEETLDLSTWNLNTLEPCPTSVHHLLLSHPKISLDVQYDTSHRFDIPVTSKSVETDINHLQSLVWNPFSVNSVEKNINKMVGNLMAQHSNSLESGPSSATSSDLPPWDRVTEEFRPESEVEISVPEDQSFKSKAVKNHLSIVQSEFPQLNHLPKISAMRKTLDLNDSVTNFMTLRKKEVISKDAFKDSAANVVVSEKSKEVYTEEIICEIDELTSKFITRIFDFSKQELKTLVSLGIFKDLQAFMKIDEAALDFTLKEHIKSDNKIACDSLLKLIPTKKALNIALQLDTEASLDYLKSFQHKDDRLLLCIQDLSQIQFEAVFSGHKTSKMMKLCSILAKDPGMCLILINNARQTKSFLIDTLVKISGIPIAPAISFPDYSCYLNNCEDITHEFPWEKFETIIEYNEASASIRSCISNCNAKHYILKAVLPPQDDFPSQVLEEFKIIAYSSLDFKVLQCLESEYNFVVFQRKATDQYSHETLIIDEKTCIVVVKNLNETKQVRLLSALFVKVSLKYSLMNLIFDVSTCHHTEIFSVVYASMAHFKENALKIKTFYCLSVDDMCRRIVKIAHNAKESIDVQWKSTELWLKRTWLTEEESNHEMLLCKLPCINSYVAQIMLTTYSLSDLMGLELQECIENMPVIPECILTEFHRTVHLERVIPEHSKTVQFDTQPSVQEYTPTQVGSPVVSYQRTSLPPLNTSYDMGDALSTRYETPRNFRRTKYAHLSKTPIKPHNVVRPFSSRDRFVGSSKNLKRAVEEKNRFSFSFSKHRKVMIDKENVKNDGQATLFIGK